MTVHAYMNDDELQHVFSEVLDDGQLLGYEVRKVMETVWQPRVGQADLAIECVECGKPIRNEGSLDRDRRTAILPVLSVL